LNQQKLFRTGRNKKEEKAIISFLGFQDLGNFPQKNLAQAPEQA